MPKGPTHKPDLEMATQSYSFEQFLAAVQSGRKKDSALIEYYLRANSGVPEVINQRDNFGNTALMRAITLRNRSMMLTLVRSAEIYVNEQDAVGDTVLMVAACEGMTEIVGALLARADIDPNIVNQEGYTALALAILHGETAIAMALLQDKRVDVNQQANTRRTALLWAVEKGHIDTFGALLHQAELRQGHMPPPLTQGNSLSRAQALLKASEEMAGAPALGDSSRAQADQVTGMLPCASLPAVSTIALRSESVRAGINPAPTLGEALPYDNFSVSSGIRVNKSPTKP